MTMGPSGARPQRSAEEVLGVRAGADVPTVRAAYRRLARQVHPDKVGAALGPGSPAGRASALRSASGRFQEIHVAYLAMLAAANKQQTAREQAKPAPPPAPQAQAQMGPSGGHVPQGPRAPPAAPAPPRRAPTPAAPAPAPTPAAPAAARKRKRDSGEDSDGGGGDGDGGSSGSSSRARAVNRAAAFRRGGALRAEVAAGGVALGADGLEPVVSDKRALAEARKRLLGYRQRLERARALEGSDAPPEDAVRAALWDLDRTGMTVGLLRDTGIGAEVNRSYWRKHAAEDIAEMCQDLVQRWREVAARSGVPKSCAPPVNQSDV